MSLIRCSWIIWEDDRWTIARKWTVAIKTQLRAGKTFKTLSVPYFLNQSSMISVPLIAQSTSNTSSERVKQAPTRNPKWRSSQKQNITYLFLPARNVFPNHNVSVSEIKLWFWMFSSRRWASVVIFIGANEGQSGSLWGTLAQMPCLSESFTSACVEIL